MLDTHARKYVQPVLERVASLLGRLGLQPTHVTWAALFFGVLSALLVGLTPPTIALTCLWLSGFLDALDGTLARQSGHGSAWGTLLDITFDRVVEVFVIVALAVTTPQARMMLSVLMAAIVLSMTVFLTVGALTKTRGIKAFYYQAGVAERTEGLIMLSAMIIFTTWLTWISGVFAALVLFTALQRLLEAKRLFDVSDEGRSRE